MAIYQDNTNNLQQAYNYFVTQDPTLENPQIETSQFVVPGTEVPTTHYVQDPNDPTKLIEAPTELQTADSSTSDTQSTTTDNTNNQTGRSTNNYTNPQEKLTEEPEQKKYKYIDYDLDTNILLSNLRHNAQNYVKHYKWNEAKQREFYNSLNSIMNAIDEGRISTRFDGALVDVNGVLDDGTSNWWDKDGNFITQEEYDKLSDKQKKNYKNNFYANREAALYINKISQALYNKVSGSPKEEKSNLFEDSNNDFLNGFMAYLNPSGLIDVGAYKAAEIKDSSGKASTMYRAKMLQDYAKEYLNNLNTNLDFKNTPYKTIENYKGLIENLITELDNGFTPQAALILNRLNGDPSKYNPFFGIDYDKAGEEQQTPEQEAQPSNPSNNPIIVDNTPLDEYFSKQYTGQTQDFVQSNPEEANIDPDTRDLRNALYDLFNSKNITISEDYLGEVTAQQVSPILGYLYTANPQMFIQNTTENEYYGWKYIPSTLNYSNMTVIALSPDNSKISRMFVKNVASPEDYNTMLTEARQRGIVPSHQEGGIIKKENNIKETKFDDILNELKKKSNRNKQNLNKDKVISRLFSEEAMNRIALQVSPVKESKKIIIITD